ncbi:DUF3987 domain-containing protein [Saccharopolyspora erythraea]|uniref:DUF3987 domain-containing protein n=1 Tax=Saccharopolyspora erythraea TaxID=1836 RepID=UPI001F5E1F46|nr:DUF3987 domain-containing protein [Saccharopolyspora erythraea]
MSKPEHPAATPAEQPRRLRLVSDSDQPTASPEAPGTGTGPMLPPDPETERQALAQIASARAELPARDEAMFETFLGDLVRQVQPTSEADPTNILASLLAGTGVHLGGRPHIRVGDDRHPLLVWPMVIGRTGIGRKGAGWSAAKRLLTAADSGFVASNIHSGLTSGEGLTQAFADEDEGDGTEPGKGKPRPRALLPSGDRRLLAFEPEWASVMARMRREGNTLSATLRAAWEGGNLSTLGVTARIVRDAHVGILTHITPGEFHAKVSHSDMAGGTYNRFLPVFVAQTQFLPAGTGADPALIERLAVDLRARLDQGATLGQLGFSDEAAYLWRRLYVEFGGFSTEDGPIEQFLSRAAPNCLRVAGIHAALDGTATIQPPHLVAAAAFIRYAVDSARAVFRKADPVLAQLAAFIREAGPQGRTRTEITSDFFQGNAKKPRIDALLERLVADQTIARTQRRPEGRKGGRATDIVIAHEHYELTNNAPDQDKP